MSSGFDYTMLYEQFNIQSETCAGRCLYKSQGHRDFNSHVLSGFAEKVNRAFSACSGGSDAVVKSSLNLGHMWCG